MTSPSSTADSDAVVLHSTWTGIVMSVLGAFAMAAVTIAVIWTDGWSWYSAVLALVSVALAGVVTFDLPIASEFTAEGVTRRSIGRHHHLEWDEVQRLERLRVGVFRTRRDRAGGGLVARIGHRRYTLVDTIESPLEFDAVRRAMGERAEVLGLTDDLRPKEGSSPTWIYRRRHWRPDSAGGR